MSTKPPAKARKAAASTRDVLAEFANAVRDLKNPTMVSSEPMVGIRNISSYTIGLKSPFPKDEPDLQLAGPRYDSHDPTRVIADGNSVAQISHKWWMQLRREPVVARKGMVIRDDAVLSAGTPRAPEDEVDVYSDQAKANAILDPFEWIEGKTEPELVAAVEAITAEESLRRILTAVNQRIQKERLRMSLPEEGSLATDPDASENEERALRNLPWQYAKAEEVALSKLEAMFRKRDEGR